MRFSRPVLRIKTSLVFLAGTLPHGLGALRVILVCLLAGVARDVRRQQNRYGLGAGSPE